MDDGRGVITMGVAGIILVGDIALCHPETSLPPGRRRVFDDDQRWGPRAVTLKPTIVQYFLYKGRQSTLSSALGLDPRLASLSIGDFFGECHSRASSQDSNVPLDIPPTFGMAWVSPTLVWLRVRWLSIIHVVFSKQDVGCRYHGSPKRR